MTNTQLCAELKVQKEYISFNNPFYREKLNLSTYSFVSNNEVKQERRLGKYEIPPAYYFISDKNEISNAIYVQITTDLKEDFPLMEVSFSEEDIKKWKGKDLKDKCISQFFPDSTSGTIKKGDTEIGDDVPFSELYEYSKTNHIIFYATVPESVLKSIKTRCLLAAEVLSSEQSFVHDIGQLNTYWSVQFKEAKLFDNIQYKLAFRDIPVLLGIHSKLLEELKSQKIGYPTEFGKLFLKYIDMFKKSLSFISNYKTIDELIKNKLTRSAFFASKYNDIEENNPEENGRDFLSYYVTPVQRYPRYPLLLRDLNKNTPDFHPDKKLLALALQRMDDSNKDIDKTSHRVKQLILMESIQKELPGIDILEEGREVIHQLPVKITKPKIGSSILYLFTDLVVLASKGKKTNTDIMKSDIDSFQFMNGYPTSESIVVFSEGKEYIIEFKDHSEKSIWFDSFNQLRSPLLSNILCEHKFVKWTDIELGETIYPSNNIGGCYYNGCAYFIGSIDSNFSLIKYDIENNQWSSEPTPISSRSFFTVNIINNIIYVSFGCKTKSKLFGSIWKYIIDDNKWEEIQLKEYSRFGHSSIVYNNKIIFFGGRNSHKYFNDILIFDPTNNQIEEIQNAENPPDPRMLHTATYSNTNGKNLMIVIAGKNKKKIYNDFLEYDIDKKVWTSHNINQNDKTNLINRHSHCSFIFGDYIMIIGGYSITPIDNLIIDLKNYSLLQFDQFGNVPKTFYRSSLVQLNDNRAILYGGSFGSNDSPIACAYIVDTEEGFSETREYVPRSRKQKNDDRVVITLQLGDTHSSKSSSPSKENSPLIRTNSIDRINQNNVPPLLSARENTKESMKKRTSSMIIDHANLKDINGPGAPRKVMEPINLNKNTPVSKHLNNNNLNTNNTRQTKSTRSMSNLNPQSIPAVQDLYNSKSKPRFDHPPIPSRRSHTRSSGQFNRNSYNENTTNVYNGDKPMEFSISSKFVPTEIYHKCNIDISKLAITDQTSVYQKARQLHNALLRNGNMEAEIIKYEEGRIFVKIMNEKLMKGNVFIIKKNMKFNEFQEKVKTFVGEGNVSMLMEDGKEGNLDEETYEKNINSIKEGKMKNIKLMIK
ncbi:Kelch motif family protein [Histomonas meleagridis]|uniref:Kelch motif family protein n=1 Tax=Histomonas meleagridis TaxID=135588 RepID=UPI00355A9586|nr:Kelch motif family protein [Histomonas meleagridis]KAH0803331.1 Kelch motif family protein [Histomonas meleagridis]